MDKKAVLFEFTFHKFDPAKKEAVFKYKTEFSNGESLFFTEKIILPEAPAAKDPPKELLLKILDALHIILGISYYKLYCAPKLKLNYKLSKKEADFWNVIYKKGLGEFFYKNNLDPAISPKFPYQKTSSISYGLKKNKRILVGIGGGKDSIVSTELLKMGGFDVTGFRVETGPEPNLIKDVIKKNGIGELSVKRILDKKVFGRHLYGGHIPISAIYAFLGIFSAVLYRYSYFIVANEQSSNFGNLKYKGELINHQWSKSFEFEKMFQDYVKSFMSPDIFYFSLLRPFYEIRIAKIFAGFKKYFPVFSACNRNFSLTKKTDGGLWCGQCPKCVFSFILLSAFLKKKELIDIFGKNLYQSENLLPLFEDILGFGKLKPFDCVGTFEESQSALKMAEKKFKNDFILQKFHKKVGFYPEVFETQKESNVPENFKFLGMESALILGFGKEGRITKKYLAKNHPGLKIGVADTSQSKNYLQKQKEFDIVVRSPGIKKEVLTKPSTTATNIFFSNVKGKNTIIGVTGSKGKSTTSSLIFEILKEARKEVELLGNIGKPMLEALIKGFSKNTIFVLELSSYQLDDLAFSPDIAVVTNLFQEHMDYHGGADNYYKAKKNIINFQSKDDFFVYNGKNKILRSWVKGYGGIAAPFFKSAMPAKNISLIGKHNQENISAAVSVAKILKIKDSTIKNAVNNFKGLPHRLEFVGEFKGIKFYDDAISTAPESTIAAIMALKKVDTIFLGGEDRGYDFLTLEKLIKQYKIRNAVLFPDSGNRILKSKDGVEVLKTKSMEKAVQFAYKKTAKGKICLLSSASPSYSLWKNFEEKGNQFQYFVKKMSKQGNGPNI